ncbi:MAG: Mur ligase family protein, partial [Phycisphaerae bacterium]
MKPDPRPMTLTALLTAAGYDCILDSAEETRGSVRSADQQPRVAGLAKSAGRPGSGTTGEIALITATFGNHTRLNKGLVENGLDIVTDVCADSRRAGPGSCFVAVGGTQVDGHDYIDAAVEAGASVVVTERATRVPSHVTTVRVSATASALSRLAAAFYGVQKDGPFAMPLIGVTGTNGKSTVAWLLREVLRHAGRRPALFGTIEYDLYGRVANAPLTTPGPLELCRHLREASQHGADVAVLEVSSHALDQSRTEGLAFHTGIFTNLSGDHLDYHGSWEAYREAKGKLFSGLEPGRLAILNADDESAAHMRGVTPARVMGFSVSANTADAGRSWTLSGYSSRLVADRVESDLR